MRPPPPRRDPGHGGRCLVVPDKFRGTASAGQVRAAMACAATEAGFEPVGLPISDGGEGLLEALGGEPRRTVVTGPLGSPVEAEWTFADQSGRAGVAVIEMARASGIGLVDSVRANDPVRATTRGTGELIAAAVRAGAGTVIVGCGGSATTDGGLGALEALEGILPSREVALIVACDVATTFTEAARVFGPQKGAGAAEVELLTERLVALAATYRDRFGLDPTGVARSGAAGGLAGGLYALGGHLVSGIGLVADAIDLDGQIANSEIAITGEGRLDATSLDGKAVGELIARTRRRLPLLVVAGEVSVELDPEVDAHVRVIGLVERFGRERSYREPTSCIREVVAEVLGGPIDWLGPDATRPRR